MVGIRPGGPQIGQKLKDAIPTYTQPATTGGGGAPSKRTAAAAVDTGPSAAEIAAQQAAAQAAAAAAAARQQANNQARSTANSNITQLNQQITGKTAQRQTNLSSLEALKKLVTQGLQGARDTQLSAIDRSLTEKLGQITATYEASLGDFQQNLKDNDATEADSTFSNLANRAREKGDVLTQALSQGAGESDLLRAQLQALRNWAGNQADINRSYFDTRSSINAGITDLNQATRTSRINEEQSANASRSKVWDDFYGSQADAYTQMSNLDQQNYLLQGEIDSAEEAKRQSQLVLDWLNAGNDYESFVEPTLSSTAARKPAAYTSPYAAQAAKAASSTWKDPGISKETQAWRGEQTTEGQLNSAEQWAAAGNTPTKKRPEGAGLRKW